MALSEVPVNAALSESIFHEMNLNYLPPFYILLLQNIISCYALYTKVILKYLFLHYTSLSSSSQSL